jgi:uncharacterized protein YfkK (UPF0435 family)
LSQRFLILNIYMENHQITVADLNGLRDIIDIACTRGAFRAQEMQQVGELYNKLSGFLEAVVAQAQEQSGNTDNAEQPKGE